jgi:hypothetical protein
MACRPPYHPQLGHTTWGSLVWWHCGQVLRAGTDRVQALARRLRLFDFEVFFFGTAIFSGSLSARRAERAAVFGQASGCEA